MKSLIDHLSQYASYHRNAANVLTHVVGIPMIVVGTTAFLSRPAVLAGAVPLSPAVAVAAGAVLFYLRLDRRYGVAMAALLALALWGGATLAAGTTRTWLAVSGGLFVAGWSVQFVGHGVEGRKPAFLDDLVGLAVGPLFLVAEAGFLLGLRREVRDSVRSRLGGR